MRHLFLETREWKCKMKIVETNFFKALNKKKNSYRRLPYINDEKKIKTIEMKTNDRYFLA